MLGGMKVTLRLRNLESGELLLGEFENLDDVRTWLADRPDGMEVVGVATLTGAGLDEDVAASLRAAMRPLDAAELARSKALDEARLQDLRDEIARQQAAFEAETAAAREALVNADPDAPMNIAYDERHGIAHADPADSREIPDVVRRAVLAWVAERNEWVRPRRSHVARATVTVWPGPVPNAEAGAEESERVQPGGQFEVEPGLPD
jgi:hypothetical protein